MSSQAQQQHQFEKLLSDVSRAGVFHLPHWSSSSTQHATAVAAAEACGYKVFRIDLRHANTLDKLLGAIGSAMGFPEWFGYNLDALADCLGDMGWCPAEGYLVILEHCDMLQAHTAEELATALQVFENAAVEWRERGIAFWCFVEMQADGIAWLPGLESQ